MQNVKLRLGAKFGLVLGALALVIVVVGVVGLTGIASMKNDSDEVGVVLQHSNRDSEVIGQLNEVGGLVRFYTLTDSDTPELKNRLHARLASLMPEIKNDLANMRKRYVMDADCLALAKKLTAD